MKIVFITKTPSSPSFQFYKDSFKHIEHFNSVEKLDFITKKYEDSIFLKYDFVIFMGGSVRKEKAREVNPNIKIVVIDSRAGHKDNLKNIDLLICNSLEMQIFLLVHNYQGCFYLIYVLCFLRSPIITSEVEVSILIGCILSFSVLDGIAYRVVGNLLYFCLL